MNPTERSISFALYKLFHDALRQMPETTPQAIEQKLFLRFMAQNDGSMTPGRFAAILASNREIVEIELDLAKIRRA